MKKKQRRRAGSGCLTSRAQEKTGETPVAGTSWVRGEKRREKKREEHHRITHANYTPAYNWLWAGTHWEEREAGLSETLAWLSCIAFAFTFGAVMQLSLCLSLAVLLLPASSSCSFYLRAFTFEASLALARKKNQFMMIRLSFQLRGKSTTLFKLNAFQVTAQ